MLLDNGTDLHSFQPAVKDIMKVSGCDLLIYVGGESDEWIEDALKSAQNKNMKTINLMEVLADSIKEEETVEGMQENEHGHEHEDEKEYDEHVWTSLRNASPVCDAIAETLTEMDPENTDIYQSNACLLYTSGCPEWNLCAWRTGNRFRVCGNSDLWSY